MVEYNTDTLQYIQAPGRVKKYELIQDSLELVEQRMLMDQPGQNRLLREAAQQLFQAGGKRIRAAICLYSAGVFGADFERSISLASGIEMLHTATLVHDDLIDGSLMRRGRPTLNAGQSAEFSILIGDYFFARAANLVAETDNVAITNQFALTLMTILNGEINQHFSRWRADRSEYFDRIYAKTGAMFVLAAGAAATLGQADDVQRKALERFGYYVGTAFQIVDDVLDFTGSESQMGKPVGSDLRQGILTLPALLYFEKTPEDPNISILLGKQDGDHHAAASLISSILESSAVEDAMEEAKGLAEEGKHVLNSVPDSEYKEGLSAIADTVITRTV